VARREAPVSTWRKVFDLPDHKKRQSADGIVIEEVKQPDGSWTSTRTYSDGRRYEATARSRTAATKETQRMANR
jgi:hypothetical protein